MRPSKSSQLVLKRDVGPALLVCHRCRQPQMLSQGLPYYFYNITQNVLPKVVFTSITVIVSYHRSC